MNRKEIAAGLPKTAGYRYAKRAGEQLYISGQVPHDASGEIVGEKDCYLQAEQCLVNLGLLLRCHGFENDDIQHLTIYVVGSHDNLTDAWRAVEDAFADGVPPATLLGVACLGYAEQRVEIDATVVKSSPNNA